MSHDKSMKNLYFFVVVYLPLSLAFRGLLWKNKTLGQNTRQPSRNNDWNTEEGSQGLFTQDGISRAGMTTRQRWKSQATKKAGKQTEGSRIPKIQGETKFSK